MPSTAEMGATPTDDKLMHITPSTKHRALRALSSTIQVFVQHTKVRVKTIADRSVGKLATIGYSTMRLQNSRRQVLMDYAHDKTAENLVNITARLQETIAPSTSASTQLHTPPNSINDGYATPINMDVVATEAAAAVTSSLKLAAEMVQGLNDLTAMKIKLGHMLVHNKFYSDEYEPFKSMGPLMQQLANKTAELRIKRAEQYVFGKSNTLCQDNSAVDVSSIDTSIATVDAVSTLDTPGKSGYLMKRGHGKYIYTWNRRLFTLRGDNLVYIDGKSQSTTIAASLRLCAVTAAYTGRRRNCFLVITPAKLFKLQAASKTDCLEWLAALRAGIARASDSDCSNEELVDGGVYACKQVCTVGVATKMLDNRDPLVDQIWAIPGNELCTDCDATIKYLDKENSLATLSSK